MCTVLLPLGVIPIAVNKYIISFGRTSLDELSARRKEIKQGSQRQYNVIFRPFRAIIFAVEKH
jgi:hypothetical protein